MYGIHSFKIIHNRGTGALKQVASVLKNIHNVKSLNMKGTIRWRRNNNSRNEIIKLIYIFKYTCFFI